MTPQKEEPEILDEAFGLMEVKTEAENSSTRASSSHGGRVAGEACGARTATPCGEVASRPRTASCCSAGG